MLDITQIHTHIQRKTVAANLTIKRSVKKELSKRKVTTTLVTMEANRLKVNNIHTGCMYFVFLNGFYSVNEWTKTQLKDFLLIFFKFL